MFADDREGNTISVNCMRVVRHLIARGVKIQ